MILKSNLNARANPVLSLSNLLLEMYKKTEVPRGNKPVDPRADPKFFNYTWTNWWDMVDHGNDLDESHQFLANPETIFNVK